MLVEPRRRSARQPRMTRATILPCALLLTGCSSVYLKHPTTQAVAECEPSRWFGPTTWWSVFPGQMFVHQYLCEKKWREAGYREVPKCKDALPGELCIS